jgi:glycerol-3-phosphate cytidylyltransferase-like family protein
MGDDWQGTFDKLSAFCEVCYMQRTPNIPTTNLKKYIKNSEENKI